jgi:hypothetical protein
VASSLSRRNARKGVGSATQGLRYVLNPDESLYLVGAPAARILSMLQIHADGWSQGLKSSIAAGHSLVELDSSLTL